MPVFIYALQPVGVAVFVWLQIARQGKFQADIGAVYRDGDGPGLFKPAAPDKLLVCFLVEIGQLGEVGLNFLFLLQGCLQCPGLNDADALAAAEKQAAIARFEGVTALESFIGQAVFPVNAV